MHAAHIEQTNDRYPCAQTFTQHSASARVSWPTRNTAEISYKGALSRSAFYALRAQALQATQGADSLVIRVDTALVISIDMPDNPHVMYAGNTAPGCLVVSLDQRDAWERHAREMAEIGVMRIVFLSSQLPLAYAMAGSLAAIRSKSTAGTPE